MRKPKPCPECRCADIDVDSAQGGSWAQCEDCGFKVQRACSEEAVVKTWNAIPRLEKA